MNDTRIVFSPHSTVFSVRYAVTGEVKDGPAVISNRPLHRHEDGTFEVTITLSNARATRPGSEDADSARRILAIAHPGSIEPGQVEIVNVRAVA